MVGRQLILRKEAPLNLREVAARTTLREVRQKGHAYVDLRHAGKRAIFFCTLCLTPCYSDTVLFDHLQGNLHARRLAAAKVTLFGSTPWPFNDGVLFFDCSLQSSLLPLGSDSQNDMSLVVYNSSGTDDEVTSQSKGNFHKNHHALNLFESRHHSEDHVSALKCNDSLNPKLSLAVSRRKTSSRSTSAVQNMILNCNWTENTLAIPAVVLKEQLSDLVVRHLGVGQIACRIQENKEACSKITKIWCAWLGEGGSDIRNELDVSTNCDFAIVSFPYAYGLGIKRSLDAEEPPMSPASFFEIDEAARSKKRKTKSFSDPEDYSENLNASCGLPEGSNSYTTVADDPQHLERRVISSKVASRHELRKQKRLAAERTCDICGQPMLPGKDVATLLNCHTGNLACSSRNTNGAFHPFHVSCLIHWILLCEVEMLANPKKKKKNIRRPSKGRKGKATLQNKISSIFCTECQGTGVAIQGEELEKPTIPLSEMFLYKLKAIEANKAWMKHPEILQKCSTGLHFPSERVSNCEENVKPLKLLHFFRVDG
ncbi:uncharacterized protein LOC122019778 [Zingiber officinale]|uniref:uncharacterized protein LOC122019778 n=1 Tax=Zingiber officinale TaxID=94328 RepID=UPI001C4D4230|nr:uncharacterized protein LOC122019778 [Zingiber officinale]